MICPFCKADIPENLVASHRAREMGKKGGAIGGKSTSDKKRRSSKRNLEQWRKRQEEK